LQSQSSQPPPPAGAGGEFVAADVPPVAGAPLAVNSPVEESSMNPSQPAAFTFQLSPEPPLAVANVLSPSVDDDAMDAAWFAPPEPAASAAASDDPASDALANVLTDAATRTPPPARALPLPVRDAPAPNPAPSAQPSPTPARARTLPRPITIDEPLTDPPMLVTPTSGHQISQLLTAPSDEPAPVASEDRISSQLPKTKPLSFPSDIKHMISAAPERSASRMPQQTTSPAPERSASPVPAHAVSTTATEHEPSPEPPRAETEQVVSPATPERASGAVAVEAPGEAAAVVRDTSTFKVIGYALVAMAFSYIGMSALVAWLSDANQDSAATAPMATTAQAAHTDVEAGEEPVAVPPEAAGAEAKPAPSAPRVSSEAAGKEQVAIEDLPVPAGLALGADKGVLKLVTPDAHSLYVDGEFAGRGPVRIVPLPPGKHMIKTRFDGEEKSYEANVQAGRMTRLTISAAK
ncbi:MAG TPA: hypothetical protein VI197_15275, partial [Polyangiaceae bacterium]